MEEGMDTVELGARRKRGFASMSVEKQREIASKGGKAAHEKGTAHEFTSEEARKAGQKGGEKTAKVYGREFYKEFGREGGEAVSRDRKHMATIGRKGGESRGEAKTLVEREPGSV